MSVGLLIKEGQVGRKILPVEKLKINNIGGGESYWIPEETTEVDSLDVSENGLYFAINDDLDGYDQVNVNVPPDMDDDDIAKGRKITGTGDDGNDYAYGLDEDGNLTVEQIPAAIHIVVPPRKLKYEEGETLNFTGIHVYLMNGNNQRYTDEDYPTGEIPFDELMFPVTIAKASDGTLNYVSEEVSNVAPPPYPIINIAQITDVYERFDWVGRLFVYSSVIACAFVYPSSSSIFSIRIIFASKSEFTYGHANYKSYNNPPESPYFVYQSSPYTYNGKTAYYGAYGINILVGDPRNTLPYTEASEGSVIFNNNAKIAWAMLYGDVSGDNKIPVQWMRSDGKILEDKFEIEIGEGGQPEPQQPDPWAGSADVSWGGHHYNINRRIVPQVHYANGYCWQEGTSEYTVEQAASMGWLILIR